ncbi:competence protein CoiA [Amphibacillus sp. Q70]|uniref:competence protein CoiA n=1 Tax=Amphibacillus sp. Q70 TaxID=3453416 RepID=UPI003F82E15B
MLQAVTRNGDYVIPALLPHDQINQLRKSKMLFYCPVCKNKLIIKAGSKVIAHFAHQYFHECPNRAGGEGIYHERGKLDLFSWLKRQGYHVKLEYYLPKIKQRADLFISLPNKRIAIEYQCATIPLKEILNRTKGYQSIGIIPLWFLGGQRMNRLGKQGLYLTPIEQNFLHQTSNDQFPKLLFYCPDTKQIARYDLICLSGQRRSIGQLQFVQSKKITLVQLLQPHKLFIFTEQWLSEKRRFRLYLPKRTYSHERQFREWLYLNQLIPSLLSSWVGLPVPGQWMMKVPIWTWQARLCYDFFNKQSYFTLEQLQKFMQPYRKNINSQFPLIQKGEDKDPVLNYLNYFILGGKIIREHEVYSVKGKIGQYQSVEQAIRNDQFIQVNLKKRLYQHL